MASNKKTLSNAIQIKGCKRDKLYPFSYPYILLSMLNFLFFFAPLCADKPGYFEPWGKDSNLILHKEIPDPQTRTDLLSIAAEKVILFHQNIISPVDGPRSHFRPTSARYMLLAMRRYGFFLGYIKGCDRLLRENKDPWIYRTRVINNTLYKWDPTY